MPTAGAMDCPLPGCSRNSSLVRCAAWSNGEATIESGARMACEVDRLRWPRVRRPYQLPWSRRGHLLSSQLSLPADTKYNIRRLSWGSGRAVPELPVPHVCLSVCLPVYVSVCLSVCLSVSLSLSLSLCRSLSSPPSA